MRDKLTAAAGLASLMLIAPVQAIAQQTEPTTPAQPPQWYWGPGPWHMWNDSYGWHFWWMPFPMMLFMLVVFGAVIYVLFARGHGSGGPHHGGPFGHMMDRTWSPPTHSALQILNERLARGEIQKDEYEDKKTAILSGGQR